MCVRFCFGQLIDTVIQKLRTASKSFQQVVCDFISVDVATLSFLKYRLDTRECNLILARDHDFQF